MTFKLGIAFFLIAILFLGYLSSQRLVANLFHLNAETDYFNGDLVSSNANFESAYKFARHPQYKLNEILTRNSDVTKEYNIVTEDFNEVNNIRPLWYQAYWLEYLNTRSIESLNQSIKVGAWLPKFQDSMTRYFLLNWEYVSLIEKLSVIKYWLNLDEAGFFNSNKINQYRNSNINALPLCKILRNKSDALIKVCKLR